jgi:hypothetical protein
LNSTRVAYIDWLRSHDKLHAANTRFADGVAGQLPEAELLARAHQVALLQEQERQNLSALSALRIWPRRNAVERSTLPAESLAA